MCAHFLRIFYQGQTSFVLGFRIFIVLLFWNAGKFEPATSTFCIHSIYLCQFGKDHRNQHPTFSLNTINVIKKPVRMRCICTITLRPWRIADGNDSQLKLTAKISHIYYQNKILEYEFRWSHTWYHIFILFVYNLDVYFSFK